MLCIIYKTRSRLMIISTFVVLQGYSWIRLAHFAGFL